ncbi:YjbE family putative metal transport protein [Oceanobacillus caeni]|uniref:Membrane protein n=1 Tax=Oceanobacillus caeni TaxID=405946 RepID=A0ABR5MIU6_9BACI|nr:MULTISPECIES: YjbE family putative metal transport protein [Bacillaceae]KKE80371.1 membrane protein [Bacilli bacterium VT-13-104]PZD83043.1 TerC family protein [Bacilli bacterium]KPH74617.1 membrane protein [Oceanobacillus caeni]MBU8791864.1 YjbE family putative metal transport protein [Oceanobacillus caeni]MCR1835416.1 YjbE family putative metal transport protein [Oceanobacillus caeni]
MEFIQPILEILFINILLSGDNALVIAMASRNLPKELQGRAIQWGTLGAISLRTLFVFLMIHLLEMPFIQLIGGILLLFIAYKLMVDSHETDQIKSGNSLQEAISIIIFVDVIMSLDNVLAIAAIADSNLLLIIAGIILSIPIILTASELILKLIQKFPIVVFIGAALLAWTGGEMIIKEEMVRAIFQTNNVLSLFFLIGLTVIVIIIGAIKRKQV